MELESDAARQFEALKPELLDDDEDARYETARKMARLGREIIPRAIDLAHHELPRFRDMACYILGQVGFLETPDAGLLTRYPDGIPTLVETAKHDLDEEVRASAISALGFHADLSTLPLIIEAASDESEEIRISATYALNHFYSNVFDRAPVHEHLRRQLLEALLRLTYDTDDDVRDWATFGLHNGDHDTPEVRARFWELLDDPFDDVKGEAAAGLGKFGDRSFIPRLREMLKEENTHTCYFEAAEYLGDESLLPDVLAAAEKWREDLEEGEKLHHDISSAIESLEKVAAGIPVYRWWDPK